jgi:uncharacterized protein (DUF58 family)
LEENIRENISQKLSDVYDTAIAQKLYYEKKAIESKLKSRGIQSILTRPEQLTIDVLNKYLEIKAKRLK